MEISLNDVLKDLYHISGFRVSVHDLDFRETACYPQQLSGFCSCIQQNPAGRQLCLENDKKAFEMVKKTEKPYIYQCCFGLYEAVAPLFYYDELYGYLMMGQGIGKTPDAAEQILSLSDGFVQDKELIGEKIMGLPCCTRDEIASYLDIMCICAQYITLNNRFGPVNLPQSVMRFLKRHYMEKLTLESLSIHFHCSKATLTNSFKREYGQTIGEALTRMRLKKAKEMLKDGGGSIARVAQECGFGEQNYFSRIFRKQFGITPSQYRDNQK